MSIAFKEWSGICALIRDGQQSIIIRKGGIAEGRKGFDFSHQRFFLFPTLFHQQSVATTRTASSEPSIETSEDGKPLTFEVDTIVDLVAAKTLRDWALVKKLEPFHSWTEEIIRERFVYDDAKGLEAGAVSVALVRAFRLRDPAMLPYVPKYGGCRSWVEIDLADPCSEEALVPAMDDGEHAALADELGAILA